MVRNDWLKIDGKQTEGKLNDGHFWGSGKGNKRVKRFLHDKKRLLRHIRP